MYRGSRGSAGVMMVAVMALVTFLCVSLIATISIVTRVMRAQSEVEAMALEAADTASGRLPGVPCESADERAQDIGVQLLACVIEERDARVDAVVTLGYLTFPIRAHAGPPRQ